MTATVLQTFLRLNLLDLAGDDARLAKLTAAASDLGDQLARAPATALSLLMGALRSDAPAETMAQVAASIEHHWTTYQSAFQSGAAGTLYRAVALQALFDAIELQPPLGVAISLLLRNFGPLLELGKNGPAVELLRTSADAAFAREARAANGVEGGELRVAASPAVAPRVFKREDIQKRVDASVGPTNKANQANDAPNPHWPNVGQPWSYEFADRLSAILTDFLNSTLNAAAKSDAGNLNALAAKLDDALGQIDVRARRSTSLLWWRQALFSETAEKSYRELDALDLVAHIALDLATLVPVAYERALESFLTEAVLAVQPSKPKLKASDIVKVCARLQDKVRSASGVSPSSDLVIGGSLDASGILAARGLSLSASEWTVWILRELKAVAAVSAPKAVLPRVVASPAAEGIAPTGAETKEASQ